MTVGFEQCRQSSVDSGVLDVLRSLRGQKRSRKCLCTEWSGGCGCGGLRSGGFEGGQARLETSQVRSWNQDSLFFGDRHWIFLAGFVPAIRVN
jgi:hypothetical protein